MKGLSSSETRQLILSVGTHSSERPLSPIEVAKLMQKTLNTGERRIDIAEKLHLEDSTMIGRFVRLLSLPSEIQQCVGWRSNPSTLSFSAATEIARLKSTQQQNVLAKAVLENRLNRYEILQVVQIQRRSEKSIEDSIKAVLDQRPVIERRHVIIGSLLSKRLKDDLEKMSQSERNDLLESALDRYGPNTPRLGSKLGNSYFMLIGDDSFHAAITDIPNGFEESVTQYLTQELYN